MIVRRRLLACAALIAAMSVPRLLLAQPLKVGDQAPDFVMAASAGGEVRLSDFRGKQMVLIEFYHADFGPT